jgi:hypothetical protein
MKRVLRVPQLTVCLVVVAILAGVAWADPTGDANVSQVLNGVTFAGPTGGSQRVFLATDPITIEAVYYDNNEACEGVAPMFVQLFVFTEEGEIEAGFDASNSPATVLGPKFRVLFLNLDPDALPVGSHRATFLVRSCDDTRSFIPPELLGIRVVAP